jgi:hypothetical protein
LLGILHLVGKMAVESAEDHTDAVQDTALLGTRL